MWRRAQQKSVAGVIKLRRWTWIRLELKKDSSAVEKQAFIGTHKDNVEEEGREGGGGGKMMEYARLGQTSV